MKKYKVLKTYNEFIQKGDIIEYNEWIGLYGNKYITYKHKMLSADFVENNKEFFEEVK